MKRLGLALCFALLGLAPAQSQPVTQPAPVGVAGAYNTVAPTCTASQFCYLQVDVNGLLKVSGTFTPSASSPEFTPVAPATATATKGVLNGCQYDSTQKTLTDGQQSATSCSARGAFIVVPGAENFGVQATLPTTPLIASGNGVVDTLTTEASQATSTVASTALAANQVINAAATNLYAFEVAADSTLSAAAWWIMIYNATSAPVDGAVTPAKCYAMPAGVTGFSAAWPKPVRFSTGVTIGVSTTGCFTKTASTHAFISGDYK